MRCTQVPAALNFSHTEGPASLDPNSSLIEIDIRRVRAPPFLTAGLALVHCGQPPAAVGAI